MWTWKEYFISKKWVIYLSTFNQFEVGLVLGNKTFALHLGYFHLEKWG